ncbi:MAG: ABC-F family ATP-binding cassette domain-containing protein [Bradymonadaceae bacterium]|nr:ABC-F family ATP-binding cassette domain-containing protein [Lujinxingiaceae bacterium]
MIVLTAENLSKAYGVQSLFKEVSFGIADTEKVGLIGVNGAGKSTLIRILTGIEAQDSGKVTYSRDARIEYLSQNPLLDDNLSALDAVLGDGPQAFQIVRAYEEACRALELDATGSMALVERVTSLGEEMDRVNGWTLESDAKTTLTKLGIEDCTALVGAMSGGQKKRVALARALMRPSDLLILDEPTNHLDVTTVAWLENYLAQRQSGLLLITHDRYFLDRVTNVILEIDNGQVHRHSGNYSAFLESRANREASLAQQEQKRSQLAKRELEWLRRGPKARTTKSKSRIDRAHELLNTSYARDEQRVEIDTLESRLGKKIIEIEGVSKAFDGKTVLRDLTYFATRRDRIGIIGPNGAGKSTLLNIIAGRVQPDSGSVEIGATVVIGYYDQESMQLDESMRVHDYITEIAHRIPTSDGFLTATQMLELFLFDRDRQWTYIAKLSGGEKRRLYLLRILMSQPNVLLLDEPTNDLDVETLSVLEDYLDSFEGVVLVVSHDRYFLDRTVEHMLSFEPDSSVVEFPGNYTLWAERQKEREGLARDEQRARAAMPATVTKAVSVPAKTMQGAKLSFNEQREFETLDRRVAQIEARLEAINEAMIASADDFEAVAPLHEEKLTLERELEASLERWMALGERV